MTNSDENYDHLKSKHFKTMTRLKAVKHVAVIEHSTHFTDVHVVFYMDHAILDLCKFRALIMPK